MLQSGSRFLIVPFPQPELKTESIIIKIFTHKSRILLAVLGLVSSTCNAGCSRSTTTSRMSSYPQTAVLRILHARIRRKLNSCKFIGARSINKIRNLLLCTLHTCSLQQPVTQGHSQLLADTIRDVITSTSAIPHTCMLLCHIL